VPHIRFVNLALAIGLGIGLLTFTPGDAQIKPPPDFTMEKGKDSPGPVTFSHEKHKAKVEKCTACHTKIFKMKKGTSGPVTLAALQEGKFCGSCHDGKTKIADVTPFAIDSCEKCHKQ